MPKQIEISTRADDKGASFAIAVIDQDGNLAGFQLKADIVVPGSMDQLSADLAAANNEILALRTQVQTLAARLDK